MMTINLLRGDFSPPPPSSSSSIEFVTFIMFTTPIWQHECAKQYSLNMASTRSQAEKDQPTNTTTEYRISHWQVRRNQICPRSSCNMQMLNVCKRGCSCGIGRTVVTHVLTRRSLFLLPILHHKDDYFEFIRSNRTHCSHNTRISIWKWWSREGKQKATAHTITQCNESLSATISTSFVDHIWKETCKICNMKDWKWGTAYDDSYLFRTDSI